jgi:hypothetical protein
LAKSGSIALLGCDCGELGCRPLEVRVLIDGDLVTWRDFAQPFHPDRDYENLGSFVFRRSQYDHAVRATLTALGARAT